MAKEEKLYSVRVLAYGRDWDCWLPPPQRVTFVPGCIAIQGSQSVLYVTGPTPTEPRAVAQFARRCANLAEIASAVGSYGTNRGWTGSYVEDHVLARISDRWTWTWASEPEPLEGQIVYLRFEMHDWVVGSGGRVTPDLALRELAGARLVTPGIREDSDDRASLWVSEAGPSYRRDEFAFVGDHVTIRVSGVVVPADAIDFATAVSYDPPPLRTYSIPEVRREWLRGITVEAIRRVDPQRMMNFHVVRIPGFDELRIDEDSVVTAEAR